MSGEATATAETAAVARLLTDPLNRFYRYPAARFVLPLFLKTSITPNQVTYVHTTVGITAAVCVAQGSFRALILAFFLSEVRLVLDCVDGEIARAKKTSSAYGRTLDALGDAVSFLAMCVAIYVHVSDARPGFPVALALVVMMGLSGLMAWVHDFYYRKFGTALKSGTDAVYDDLRAKHRVLQGERRGARGFVTRFGFAFDWMQVAVFQSGVRRDIEARLAAQSADPPEHSMAEVQWILKNAQSRTMRPTLRAISLVSADNVIGILNVALLTGSLITAQLLVIAYAVFSMAACVLLATLFLHGNRRTLARQSFPPR